MKIVDRKIDAAVQAYGKRWLNSLERPRASIILSNLVITFFLLYWSATLTTMFGYDLKKGPGTLIFIGIWLFFSLVMLLVARVMTRLGINQPIRSAFLLAAIIGPYINLAAYRAWNQPTLSHILGYTGSILAFFFSLLIDKISARTPTQTKQG